MTLSGTVTRTTNGEYQYMYTLVAPATGAHNIVITASATMDLIAASSVSYTGTKQSAQPDAYTTVPVGTATSVTTTATTNYDNCWLAGFFVSDGGGGWTAGASTTLRDPTGNCIFLDSNAAKSIPGSYSLIATHASNMLSGQMISIIPVESTKSASMSDTVVDTDSITSIKTQSATISDTVVDTDSLVNNKTRSYSNQTKNTNNWTDQIKN